MILNEKVANLHDQGECRDGLKRVERSLRHKSLTSKIVEDQLRKQSFQVATRSL